MVTKKQKLTLLCILLIILQTVSLVGSFADSQSQQEIQVGSYVQMGEYQGSPMIWQVINVDGEGNLLLWSEYSVGKKSFDSKVYADPVNYTLESWDKSTIRTWLNSDEKVVRYTGAKPDAKGAENPYEDEAGFLTNFSDFEKSIIKESRYKWAVYGDYKGKTDGGSETYKFVNMSLAPNQSLLNYDNALYVQLNDKVFLLSIKELNDYVYSKGLPIVKKHPNGENIIEYRLRTPAYFKENPMTIHMQGHAMDGGSFYSGNYGTETLPAMYIDPSAGYIKGFGTKANPYIISDKQSKESVTGMSLWAKTIIMEAMDNGLLTSSTKEGFKDTITRQEYAELSLNLYENLTGTKITTVKQSPFKDTDNQSIIGAYTLGIVNGTTSDTFEPNDYINREQMAVMFYRTISKVASDISDLRKSAQFSDKGRISDYALESVEYLNSYGIINGVGGNKFNPYGTATKEEAIAIMMRIAKGFDGFKRTSSPPEKITIGDKGDVVTSLQLKLNRYSQMNNLAPITVSGVYDAETKNRVVEFQKNLSLPITDILTKDTYLAIIKDSAWNSANEEIHFPDKELERIVRESINKSSGPIYSRDVLDISFLDIGYKGEVVKNLEGLQWLKNLNSLVVMKSEATDYNVISQLKYLNRLTVQDCNIKDIGFLKGLDYLTYLNLSDNNISDISAIKDLKNLMILQLRQNKISDLTDIKDLNNLIDLGVYDNDISDISSIKNLTNLGSLDLSYNKVSDISSLKDMSKLQILFLGDNRVSDISALEGKIQLVRLSLDNNKISNFDPIADMVEVKYLDLSGMGIKDISFLENCKKFQELYLSNNKISSIEPLKNLVYLKTCYIDHNEITDFTPILTWQNINNLYALKNKTTDFESLKYLTNLVNLSISIPDITYLNTIKQDLEYLLSTKYLNIVLLDEKIEDRSEGYLHREELMDQSYYETGEKIDQIISDIFKPGMSDYDKVKAAHDYLCTNLKYDYSYYREITRKNIPEDYVYTRTTNLDYLDVLLGKTTICSGYSHTFKFLMDKAGVECYYVVGMVGDLGHAWNIVKLDGKYYNIDVTWDDNDLPDNVLDYDYFLVSDERMKESRTWDESLYPQCPEKYSK